MVKKTCAILQPHYLPWLGYFEMMDSVDVFVFLDDVQFIKREWKNRNRIRKTHNHKDGKWLSVPIMRCDQKSLMCEARLAQESDWVSIHLNSIKGTYSHAPYFSVFFPLLEYWFYNAKKETLSELNISLLIELSSMLGIQTEFLRSSELNVFEKKEYKLLGICKKIGASKLIANNASTSYVNAGFFNNSQINFLTQDYEHPMYPQVSGNEKLSPLLYLSIIDLFFNVGPGPDSMSVIRQGGKTR